MEINESSNCFEMKVVALEFLMKHFENYAPILYAGNLLNQVTLTPQKTSESEFFTIRHYLNVNYSSFERVRAFKL